MVQNAALTPSRTQCNGDDTQSRNLRKKLAQFLASNFRASSCKFGWRHIK